MEEKKLVVFRKIFWPIIFGLSIIIPFVLNALHVYSKLNAEYLIIAFYLYPIVAITLLAIMIEMLKLSYKEYYFDNGMVITVYAGIRHHTLRVNGEIVDEFIGNSSLIYLTTILDGNLEVEVKISSLKKITLKINDKLINETRKY